MFSSAFTIAAGLITSSGPTQLCGFAGMTLSSCYLLWYYLTENKYQETNKYNDVKTSITSLRSMINMQLNPGGSQVEGQ